MRRRQLTSASDAQKKDRRSRSVSCNNLKQENCSGLLTKVVKNGQDIMLSIGFAALFASVVPVLGRGQEELYLNISEKCSTRDVEKSQTKPCKRRMDLQTFDS